MKKQAKVIAISAGQLSHKKTNSAIQKRITYLNYGLLGLVTMLKEHLSMDIAMFQADARSPKELLDCIERESVALNDCDHMLLSIPSFYSVSWCHEFCKTVKANYDIKIIAGGRWVVDGNLPWLREKIGNIDEYVEGFGERKLIELFGGDTSGIADGACQCFEKLDYSLLYNYRSYNPCIEVSRGCGAGCAFCADRHNRRMQNKDVWKIAKELDALDLLYDKYSYYMEAPHFIFEKRWVEDLREGLCKRQGIHPWRCTSRVESVRLEALEKLAESGLKVIDVGLESASPEQLRRMGKSVNPHDYLDKAKKILVACKKQGIWVKLNVLLFAGETYKTIEETISWLCERRELIKGVSVSSLVYYKNMGNLNALLKAGASIPDERFLEENGYVNLDLSEEIPYRVAKKYMTEVPKMIADQRDFYDIKSVTYFPPGYTYDAFLEDLGQCLADDLPFSLNAETL